MRKWLPDAAVVLGAGAISYGIWCIYQPAAFIAAGAFMLLGGYVLAKAGEP